MPTFTNPLRSRNGWLVGLLLTSLAAGVAQAQAPKSAKPAPEAATPTATSADDKPQEVIVEGKRCVYPTDCHRDKVTRNLPALGTEEQRKKDLAEKIVVDPYLASKDPDANRTLEQKKAFEQQRGRLGPGEAQAMESVDAARIK